MIKAERQDSIKKLVEERGSASVKDIAARLDVSEMTVRRDLEEMATSGELVRVHGGARSAGARRHSMLRQEYSHTEKRDRNMAQKRAIAARAVSLIEEDSTVFLGTGTTVEQMVPLLPACRLRIVTNSLSVFNMLEGTTEYDLCLIGGMYRPRTGAFVGPLAEDAIDKLGLDIAFIGANGIYDGEVSTSNAEEGHFQELAFEKADARYLVADASKVGRRDFFSFYHLIKLDGLITDGSVPPEALQQLSEYTEVLI
ncbi:DeoR/GlpR family DNA-binding transcription regulator [Collinsella intestinalis]|uniref:DeoR/GlpR family DNA-binding transcription regulator n=1 Tax=Collinsella intestinalis TaxID=147207 RepID=UPI00195CA1F2|nr:DeoR/GlpR family DNA-binding transcription regulator [Collinsella intestinalis]MBM6682634.1 DeoR/GlpR transcriptional regulator [Collinsella intestinalis]